MLRQNAPTGAGRQIDAVLGEGGMHPELAQFRIGLQPAHDRHGLEIDLARRLPRSKQAVFQPGPALGLPARQNLVDQ